MDNNDLCLGRLESATLRGWLDANEPAIAAVPYVLIAAIDSTREVGEMPWTQQRASANTEWAIRTHPLVISGEHLLDLRSDDNLFTGFDELWFALELPVDQTPVEVSLLYPPEFDTGQPNEALKSWMLQSGCLLGVGDAFGLNFVTRDTNIQHRFGLAHKHCSTSARSLRRPST